MNLAPRTLNIREISPILPPGLCEKIVSVAEEIEYVGGWSWAQPLFDGVAAVVDSACRKSRTSGAKPLTSSPAAAKCART